MSYSFDEIAKKAIDRTNKMTISLMIKPLHRKTRTKEPSNDELIRCDTYIATWIKRYSKHKKLGNKSKSNYSKVSVIFWRTAKLQKQTEIADYRYQKKKLLRCFKLWIESVA